MNKKHIDYRKIDLTPVQNESLDSKFIAKDAYIIDDIKQLDVPEIINVNPPEGTDNQQYTEEDIRGYLSNYIKVPPEYWKYLNEGDYIRWFDISGKFNMGAYFIKNWKKFTAAYMHVSKNKPNGSDDSTAVNWNILHTNIHVLYKRVNTCCYIELLLLQTNIDTLRREIKKLKKLVKK